MKRKLSNFHLIANAGATLWQYCKDVGLSEKDYGEGLQKLSKILDSEEKINEICKDKVLLIGCFLEVKNDN